MEPHGLIPDEWILAYAAGNLSEAKAALVATHASFHPSLQNRIVAAEAIGAALMEDSGSANLSDGFFDRVMEDIDSGTDSDASPIAPKTNEDARVPAPLASYLGKELNDLKWRFMGPGMKQVRLWTGPDGEKLWLLKAKGGTEIPEHGHNGNEFTLVLQGGYKVEDKHFGVGELEIAADDLEDHRPIIDEGEDCICLVVTEAPIKLKSLVGKAFQPFIGL